jgi:hypothetical protein
MIIATALVSLGVSLLIGWVVFRRARQGVGASWEEWRYARQIGGRWAPLIKAAVRAALLAAVVGFSAPFAVEGVRRYLRTRRLAGVSDGR